MNGKMNALLVSLAALMICSVVILAGCTDKETDDTDKIDSFLPSGTSPSYTITLEGLIEGNSVSLAEIVEMEDLLEQVNVTKKNEMTTYVGIDLYELLLENDVKWGAGEVLVEAADGYSYSFNFFDLYYRPAKQGEEIVMLAIATNGEWLGNETMIVAPSYPGQSGVKKVSKITVGPWKLKVNGSVNQELDIEVTDFEDPGKYTSHTFTVTVPDKGSDEFIGIAIGDLLKKAGTNLNASNATVRVLSHDSYFVDFNYQDLLDNPESVNPIILAYSMNGEDLPFDHGALMLVAPDDNFSGDDSNWFKNSWGKCVVRLEVS